MYRAVYKSPLFPFYPADANEAHAIALAKTVFKDVKVLEIYIDGKAITRSINVRQVLVQERLTGGELSVASPEITTKSRPGSYFFALTWYLAPTYSETVQSIH
ncbi:kinase-like domain-containing protein [Penicillium sp. IBT 35674x]|nr:kinase-like domain-containing protein [Penicillium sp. IBT 35674x]